jgi:hypothetical protein
MKATFLVSLLSKVLYKYKILILPLRKFGRVISKGKSKKGSNENNILTFPVEVEGRSVSRSTDFESSSDLNPLLVEEKRDFRVDTDLRGDGHYLLRPKNIKGDLEISFSRGLGKGFLKDLGPSLVGGSHYHFMPRKRL